MLRPVHRSFPAFVARALSAPAGVPPPTRRSRGLAPLAPQCFPSQPAGTEWRLMGYFRPRRISAGHAPAQAGQTPFTSSCELLTQACAPETLVDTATTRLTATLAPSAAAPLFGGDGAER